MQREYSFDLIARWRPSAVQLSLKLSAKNCVANVSFCCSETPNWILEDRMNDEKHDVLYKLLLAT